MTGAAAFDAVPYPQSALGPLVDFLDVSDMRVILIALEAIEVILELGEKEKQGTGAPSSVFVANIHALPTFL